VHAQESVRVAIVEDQSEIRTALASLIGGAEGLECCGAFGSMESALAEFGRRALPQIALIDIQLPGMNGIEGIRQMRAKWPAICPIALTVHDDDRRVIAALCAGADGYLLKNTPPARLVEAIRDGVRGGSPMSPEIARRVVELFRKVAPPPQADYALTPHETRILKLLVEGENYKTAARKLGVSVNTVSYHVRGVYEKLHVHSRSDAVAKALRSGLA
jgi:DNA-binding NarL/FixJ family response regulator